MCNNDLNPRNVPKSNPSSAPTDLTTIIAEYLARNRGLDPDDPDHRQTPDYGIAAKLDGAVLEIALTFRRGAAYCCVEWDCHVGLRRGKRWTNLRRQLDDAGIAVAPRLELHGICMIEEGAIFFDFSKPDPDRRGWYGFAPVAMAWAYDIKYLEGVE